MSVLGRRITFCPWQQETCRYKSRTCLSIRSSLPGNKQNILVGSTKKLAKNVATGIAAAVCLAVASIASAPLVLSWPQGLNAALWVTNQAIPGKLKIGKASLGWNRPVQLDAIELEDEKGETVLWIQEIVTGASLWSIVMGRSGFGDSTVGPFRINLLDDDVYGLSRLALALEPAHKLLSSRRQPSTPKKKPPKQPTVTVKLEGNVKATDGGLVLRDGQMLLPANIAATLGNEVLVDILAGKDAVDGNNDGVSNPFKVTMWSDRAHGEATGFFNPSVKKLQLSKPIKIEMDLTPDVAHIYLSRVNPLLANIVGPAVVDEDMPDVSLQVTTKDMTFPADEYYLHFQPMKVVLARGPLVDGLMSLLSKEEVIEGKQVIKMETGVIKATVDTKDFVSCSRIDLLIGGRVHVATWGQVDMDEETIKMTLAVPSNTLKAVLGFQKLPDDYHLQIPITGSFDRPQMDIKAAGIGIAQLTIHERAGSFARGFLGVFESPREPVPKPIGDLPWAKN